MCSPLVCILLLCYAEEEVQIVSGLKNTDVFAGESATFTCELSRPGMQSVQWWLDGSPLQSSPVNEISVQDGKVYTLTLKDLGPNDSGIVTFRAGPLISSAKLLIKGILALDAVAQRATPTNHAAYASGFRWPLTTFCKMATGRHALTSKHHLTSLSAGLLQDVPLQVFFPVLVHDKV